MSDNSTSENGLEPAETDSHDTDQSDDEDAQSIDVANRSTAWAGKASQWLRTSVLSPALGIGAGMTAVNGTIGTSKIPGTTRVWKWLLKASYRGLKGSTGADLIGHELKRGHILHKPLIFNPDTGRWETQDGEEWWNGREDGADIYSGPGGVSCAWAPSASNQLGTNVQAEVSEALDVGYGATLTTNAQVIQAQGGGQQARADGGVSVQPTTQITPQSPGQFKDYVIPLQELYLDENESVDARLISMDKFYQLYPETVESEEHQRAEERARIAESDGDQAAYAMKMLLIACATIVLALAAAFVLPDLLAGGGGGGGSGIMPF